MTLKTFAKAAALCLSLGVVGAQSGSADQLAASRTPGRSISRPKCSIPPSTC